MQKFRIHRGPNFRDVVVKRVIPSLAVMCIATIGTILALPSRAMAATDIVLNQTKHDGIPYVQGENFTSWPAIVSQAAVVMDMNTGTIVYGKNPNVEHYPASITKIMTALLALKYGHLTDILTASKNAVKQPPDKLYMLPGEKEQLEPLLYGLLLDSANDAAVEIAEKYGGTVAHFAQMMNSEAASLGATHTHFVNPNGLPNPKHLTTAYDMSLIAQAAMQNPEFRKIVDTKYYNWNGQAWHSRLSNLNSMLFYYPGTIGLKTGYTSVAHETLVVAAKRGKNTFLAVLMDTPTDYEIRHDASQLLDYAFAHYHTQTVVQKGQVLGDLPGNNSAQIVAAKSVLATVEDGNKMHVASQVTYALPLQVKSGEQVGTLHLSEATGQSLATLPVTAASNWNDTSIDPATKRTPVLWPMIVILSVMAKIARVLLRRRLRRNDSATVGRLVANSFLRRD